MVFPSVWLIQVFDVRYSANSDVCFSLNPDHEFILLFTFSNQRAQAENNRAKITIKTIFRSELDIPIAPWHTFPCKIGSSDPFQQESSCE